MLKTVRELFTALFPSPPSSSAVARRIRRNRQGLVSVYSRGNPTLRRGKYVTARDIAERREHHARRVRHS